MRCLGFIFLYFCLTALLAQPGFNQSYDLDASGSGFVNGVVKGDTVIILAGLRYPAQTPWGIALIKADTNGNILSTHPYFDPEGKKIGYGYNYDIKILENNHIAFVGGYFSESAQFLIIFNEQGDVVLFKKIPYDNAYSNVTPDFEPYKGGYLIGGTVVDEQQNKFQPFLTRTDAEGNLLWTKRYPEPGRDQNSRCMKVLDDNTIIIGSVLFNIDNFTYGKSRIFALDSLGNLKWDYRVPDTNEGIISDLVKLENGDWLYLNKKLEIFPQDSILAWSQLVRRDSNFNLIFATRLSPTKWSWNQTNDLIPSPDGHWIISETTALVGPDFSWLGSDGWAGCLTKVTSQGEILWQTCDTIHWNIPGVDSEETASGHVVLPSGSSIVIGISNRWKPSPARSFGWMFKVDANGCMMEPCSVGTETPPEKPTRYGRIFPNPANQTLQVEWPPSSETTYIHLYNSIGVLVGQYRMEAWEDQKSLDVSTLHPGIFFIQITDAQGLLFAQKVVIQR